MNMKNKLFILIIFSLVVFSCEEEKDTTGPELTIVSPKNNSELKDIITIEVNTNDESGIKNVDFYIDSVNVFSDTTEPYIYEWDTKNASDSEHFIKVISYDNEGNFTESEVITVNVKNPIPLSFKIRSLGYDTPIASANLSVNDSINFTSNSNGEINFDLFKGTYSFIIKHKNYINKKLNNVEISNNYDLTIAMSYDPWDSVGVIPTPIDLSGQFSHTFSTAINNKIYFFTHNNGGFTEFGRSLDLSNDNIDNIDTGIVLCACGYGSKIVSTLNNSIYYLAGPGSIGGYDTTNDRWGGVTNLDGVDFPAGSHAAILKGDEIIIVGTRNETKETYAYNHIDDEWLVLADFPEPTDNPGLAIYNDMLYSFSGGLTKNKMYKYDRNNDEWNAMTDLPFDGPGEIRKGKFFFMYNDILYLDSENKFNFSTMNWSKHYLSRKAESRPEGSWGYSPKIVKSTNGDVYLLAQKGKNIFVYKFNPTEKFN